MLFDKLLAKSQREGEPWRDSMWLPVHLADVYRAAGQVLDATADEQLVALAIDPDTHREWKRARNLALVALASWGGQKQRETTDTEAASQSA